MYDRYKTEKDKNIYKKFKSNTELSFYPLNCTNANIGKPRLSERKESLLALPSGSGFVEQSKQQ